MMRVPSEQTLDLPSGPMRVRLHGPETGHLVLSVPGLSANRLSFDALGRHLGEAGYRVAATDLRGRGRSPAGCHGSHGWRAHARDLLHAAKALGAETFDLVGHSMGAFVGLELANMAPKRLRRFVLIDAVGVPDPRAMPPIFAAAQRLGQTHASIDAFLGAVKRAGIVPFDTFWEAHYREDLVDAPGGGVKQRASLDAIMEDMAYAGMTNVRALWPGVTSRSLLLRAGVPMGPGGDIVTEHDRDWFVQAAHEATAAEIPANHYGIMTHPETAKRIEEFLR